MADKKFEALWDCKYCGAKGIGGLTKHCPNCGHPQDKGIIFYKGEKKNYLDEDTAAQYGQGADWTCSYCGSLNRVNHKFCTNCGAPKEETSGDYFENEKKIKEKEQKKEQERMQHQQPAPKPAKNSGGVMKKFFPLLLIILAAGLLFSIFSKPKNANVQIADKSWERSVEVEAMQTVQQSDWNVPDGGRVYDQRREIHHYQQVVDHYEERSREVAVRVYDGEDYYTVDVNNGDGTFTEETRSRPRYRTEYQTEYYDAPVYRDEPVYQTKYYYDLDIWPVARTETTSGKDDEPYWPELSLRENEREGASHEVYSIEVEELQKKNTANKTFTLPQDEWEKLKIGEALDITYKHNTITKINGNEIGK